MLKFRCSFCAKKIAVAEDYAGKSVKCPRCGTPTKVPNITLEEPALVMEAGDILPPTTNPPDLVVEQEKPAPQERPTPQKKKLAPQEKLCPQCGSSVNNDTEFCITCGYRLEPDNWAISTERSIRPRAIKHAKTVAKIPLALAGGFIGAMVGAIIWGVVAYFTKYELGVIAWGVGSLTGFGLTLFTERRGILMGLLAIFFAFIGIMTGKYFVAKWVVLPQMRESLAQNNFLDGSLDDEAINKTLNDPQEMFQVACRQLAKEGAWDEYFPHDPDEYYKGRFISNVCAVNSGLSYAQLRIPSTQVERVENAREQVSYVLADWGPEKRREVIRQQHAEDMAKFKEFAHSLGQAMVQAGNEPNNPSGAKQPPAVVKETVDVLAGEKSLADTKIGLLIAFFASFSLIDILWIILAFASAYKIAAGRS